MVVAPFDPFTDWNDQQDHERMKAWLVDHGWSISMGANPADIVELKQQFELGLTDDE